MKKRRNDKTTKTMKGTRLHAEVQRVFPCCRPKKTQLTWKEGMKEGRKKRKDEKKGEKEGRNDVKEVKEGSTCSGGR